jgi:hypothetical protein
MRTFCAVVRLDLAGDVLASLVVVDEVAGDLATSDRAAVGVVRLRAAMPPLRMNDFLFMGNVLIKLNRSGAFSVAQTVVSLFLKRAKKILKKSFAQLKNSPRFA